MAIGKEWNQKQKERTEKFHEQNENKTTLRLGPNKEASIRKLALLPPLQRPKWETLLYFYYWIN